MSAGDDFAWGHSHPTAAAQIAAGKAFGISYLSTDSTKNWTAAQVQDYKTNNVGVVAVWETTAGRATQGFAAGQADANTALAQANALGMPAGRPIYFAVDTDTSWSNVLAYFQGVNSVLPKSRIGCYGSYRVIIGAQASGIVGYFWQTVAWSAGQVAAGIDLFQEAATQTIDGVVCDKDDGYLADYGQWFNPPAPPPPTAFFYGRNRHMQGLMSNLLPETPLTLDGPYATLKLFCDNGLTGQPAPGVHVVQHTGPNLWSSSDVTVDSTGAVVSVPIVAGCDFIGLSYNINSGTPVGWALV